VTLKLIQTYRLHDAYSARKPMRRESVTVADDAAGEFAA
jgi:hypothetical protein